MPWLPELFTAPALQQLLDKRRLDALVAVPFFDGLLAGEPDALLESFTGEPELHDPVRGRIKGAHAFKAFVAQMSAWLVQRNVSVEDVEHVILEGRGFEEVVLHSTVRPAESVSPSRSSPTVPADGSTNCGSTTAAGR